MDISVYWRIHQPVMLTSVFCKLLVCKHEIINKLLKKPPKNNQNENENDNKNEKENEKKWYASSLACGKRKKIIQIIQFIN